MVAAHGWDVNGAKNIGMRTPMSKDMKKLNENYLKPDDWRKSLDIQIRSFPFTATSCNGY